MENHRYLTYYNIHSWVKRIPNGKVATYGQIARLAGIPGHARQVGYALHALPEGSEVPWHRVVNAKGEISLGEHDPSSSLQRSLLESEGVSFSTGGRVSMRAYGWSM